MANRFLCGFDDYDIDGAEYEWNFYLSPTIATGLTGSCLSMTQGGGSSTCLEARVFPFPEGKASVVCGFRFLQTKIPATPWGMFMVGDATVTHLNMVISTSGQLLVYRSGETASVTGAASLSGASLLGTGATAILPGVPYYIEVELTIDNASGVCKVYLNGSATPDINLTGIDTQNAGTAFAKWIQLGGPYNGTGTSIFYFDDIYANDTTGSKNTGLEGDVQVRSHFPNANGNSSQWDRSTGADQYATIDDNPQSTTDYNSTSTLNEVDTVNIEALADAGATIKAVQVNILAKKTTSGTAAIVPVHRVDSVDYPHATNLYVPTDWMYLRQNYDQQGDATDWNETDFNASEIGYKKTV